MAARLTAAARAQAAEGAGARANSAKGSRWNRSFSRRAGKSTRSRAARKRPLLSVRRLGALGGGATELDACAASARRARRRVLTSQPRALKRHRKRAQRREPGKRRKSWPTSSVSWPRANAPKGSRWNRNFSRRAGKSTRSRAVRKRPLLSVRRPGVRGGGATGTRCNAPCRARRQRPGATDLAAARAQAAQEASASVASQASGGSLGQRAA